VAKRVGGASTSTIMVPNSRIRKKRRGTRGEEVAVGEGSGSKKKLDKRAQS